MVAWSCEHMLKGKRPTLRHDGGAFRIDEPERAMQAGAPLGFRAVVLYMKCDLAENSRSLGLPSTPDGISPSPFCFATQEDLDDFVFGWGGGQGVPGGASVLKVVQALPAGANKAEWERAVAAWRQERFDHDEWRRAHSIGLPLGAKAARLGEVLRAAGQLPPSSGQLESVCKGVEVLARLDL